MRRGHTTIAWVVESIGAPSCAVLVPDRKGRLAEAVVIAAMKKMRCFRYTGIDIPAKTIKDLSAAHAGVVITNLAKPGPVNARVVFCDDKAVMRHCWHCPVLVYMGEDKIAGAALLLREPGETPVWIIPAAAKPTTPFKVHTRNCVDDPVIQQNLVHSLALGLPNLPVCAAHGARAIMVSGGPSIFSSLEEIRAEVALGGRMVCVKHSHDYLLDAGIVPWGCSLLDPRDHVKDFIDHPDPRILYFASSTCNPTTFDRLLSRGANVWLYHARVGAGEDAMIALHNVIRAQEKNALARFAAEAGLPAPLSAAHWKADQMVSGGTTAASRGISVMHMLGFRHFVLFGYDSCYWEAKDLKEKKEDGQPRYHELKIGAEKFVTDAELVAQVQDFHHIVASLPDCTFDVRGAGMVPTVVRGKGARTQFEGVFPHH